MKDPLGQSFEIIRKDGYLFIDKTTTEKLLPLTWTTR